MAEEIQRSKRTVSTANACVHPGSFFSGGPGMSARKQTGQRFLFWFFLASTCFTVYIGGPMVLLQRKLYFPKDPEGVQHFPRGSNFFQGCGGEWQMLASIETQLACDFPGRGSGPPIPPLDPHMKCSKI